MTRTDGGGKATGEGRAGRDASAAMRWGREKGREREQRGGGVGRKERRERFGAVEARQEGAREGVADRGPRFGRRKGRALALSPFG